MENYGDFLASKVAMLMQEEDAVECGQHGLFNKDVEYFHTSHMAHIGE